MIGKRDAAACFDRLVRERDAHSRGAANELVSEWSRILAQAFDERPAGQKIWIAFGAFGNFDRAAGTADPKQKAYLRDDKHPITVFGFPSGHGSIQT